MIYFLIALIVVILILILNYLIYKRSIIVTAVELGIRIFTPFKRRDLKKQIVRKNKLLSKGYKLPKLKCNVNTETYKDMTIYILSNKTKKSKKLILYLYGGSYVSLPLYFHWRFCDKLVRKTGATLIFPLYPLAPEKNCLDTTTEIYSLYKEIVNNYDKDLLLMGDSSGGGLSILTFIHAVKEKIKKPSTMILFSPWVDISLTNTDAYKFIKIDPMIGIKGVKECRDAWVGNIPVEDARINPMCADISLLENTHIFVGTRELAYPDIMRFCDKCSQFDVNMDLVIGRGMNHNYVLYPMPPAIPYFNKVVKIINDLDKV